MAITLIHGQDHKGSTYNISKTLAEKINGKIDEFFLPKNFNGDCIGCLNCLKNGIENCPHYDELSLILNSMLSSEVIIIDTPTYCMEMSGQLKSLFDHLFTMWLSHRPNEKMFSKIGVAISTAAGAGMKNVTKSIARQMFYLGIPKVYKIPFRAAATSWEGVSKKRKAKIIRKTNKLAKTIIKIYGKVKARFKLKFMFSIMRMMQKGNDYAPLDKKYWEEKGWLKKARPWK